MLTWVVLAFYVVALGGGLNGGGFDNANGCLDIGFHDAIGLDGVALMAMPMMVVALLVVALIVVSLVVLSFLWLP